MRPAYRFLSGYFHEDWDLRAADWRQLPVLFCEENDIEVVEDTIDDLRELIGDIRRTGNADLYLRSGCYIDSRSHERGATGILEEILSLTEEALSRRLDLDPADGSH